MYLPSHFSENDPLALRGLIQEYPLGLIITPALSADLIPLEYIDGTPARLIGHIARANPLARVTPSSTVLVVFNGPSHYVSPHDYPSKLADPRVVPTYNYAMVQVKGIIKFTTDKEALLSLVTHLTTRHERTLNRTPWQVSDAPTDYIERMLAAIVGIEVEISDMIGKFKASQNRSDADRDGVRQARMATVGDAIAAWTVRPPHESK